MNSALLITFQSYIMKQPKMDEFNCADGPYAVVLAPTRELAQQIEEEAIKLAHFLGWERLGALFRCEGGWSVLEAASTFLHPLSTCEQVQDHFRRWRPVHRGAGGQVAPRV